jgi:hypothetical protein
VGTATPGTSGRITREGMLGERATSTGAVPLGSVEPNAHTGWSPPGAEIDTRTREPDR